MKKTRLGSCRWRSSCPRCRWARAAGAPQQPVRGQSYAAWFNAQHVKTKPANPEEARKIIESLDAQEAASVSKSYRQGAVSRGDEAAPPADDRDAAAGGGGEGYMPPPSVPQ